MKYLWDTDTCIYHLNGDSKVKQKVRSVGAKSISGITWTTSRNFHEDCSALIS